MKLDSLLVLVIEPSRVQRHIICDALKSVGLRHIEQFDEGTAALAALAAMQRDTPDIVLSSMHLPDMTGTELVSAMRRSDALTDVTFLLVSSETHYRFLEPIRQAGAIAILPKPFRREELRTALQSTLHYIVDRDNGEPDDSGDFENIRVLLVDDSAMSRRYLAQLLQNLGIGALTEARDGAEALVYCLTLIDTYRVRQFVSSKAPFAGNSGALAKNGNAAGRELADSLRASRQGAVRGVAFSRRRPTMPSKMRLAASPLVTRYKYLQG